MKIYKYSFGDSEVYLEDDRVVIITVAAHGIQRLSIPKSAALGLAAWINGFYDDES